jgi:hypothetical protein
VGGGMNEADILNLGFERRNRGNTLTDMDKQKAVFLMTRDPNNRDSITKIEYLGLFTGIRGVNFNTTNYLFRRGEDIIEQDETGMGNSLFSILVSNKKMKPKEINRILHTLNQQQ